MEEKSRKIAKEELAKAPSRNTNNTRGNGNGNGNGAGNGGSTLAPCSICVYSDSGKSKKHPGGDAGCPFIKQAGGDLVKAAELADKQQAANAASKGGKGRGG